MIGIFDSGVGGLSVYSEIKKLEPQAAIVYFSDHKNFPYGEKSQEELSLIVSNAVDRLLAYRANPIVVACNSATVSTIAMLRERYPEVSFVGVEPAVKVATSKTATGKIGVLATKKTVTTHDSEQLAHGKEVFKHFAPGLIDKIENNITEIKDEDVLDAVAPLAEKGIDTLVLGCTHFYFIKDRFINKLRNIEVVEPSAAVAKRVVEVANNIETGDSIFITSGDRDNFELFLNQNFGKGGYDIREV